MTKRELKAQYTIIKDRLQAAQKNDSTLIELQNLCMEYGNGHKLSSYEDNLIAIINSGNKSASNQAMYLYRKHIEIEAQMQVFNEFSVATNNFALFK